MADITRKLALERLSRNPFEASALKNKQEASQTLLGQALGIQPLTPEEQETYANNTDPNIEQALESGMNAGMQAGTLGKGLNIDIRKVMQTRNPELIKRAVQETESGIAGLAGNDYVKGMRDITNMKNLLYKIQGK